MKFVLDASVAVKWLLPEPDSSQALVLRDDFRNRLHHLIAPDTLAVEIAHALTRAERKNLLQAGESLSRLASILPALPDLHPYLPLLPRAVEISSQTRVGVYDCLYVALAEREVCGLVTADTKLVTAMQSQFPNVMHLSALP